MRHITLGMVLVLSGCASISTLQTAETNGAGNFQAAIEPAYFGAAGPSGSAALGHFNVSGRYGVSDRVDLGARLGTTGAEVLTKFQITDPDDESGVIVSLAPSFGGFYLGAEGAGIGAFHTQVPVIIGIPVGEHQFIVGPKVHAMFFGAGAEGSAATVGIVSVGSSIGFSAKIGPSFRLLPEVSVVMPIAAVGVTTDGGSASTSLSEGVIFQISTGFLFGGRKSK